MHFRKADSRKQKVSRKLIKGPRATIMYSEFHFIKSPDIFAVPKLPHSTDDRTKTHSGVRDSDQHTRV